ncbi:hypothetical protein G3I59_27020 [Amycolatopsis rubida]|uniref:Uncharacterized protein n=1 Tax=Amycolatopsis rubida TaxID=112413 RepID=A0ABX0BW62_9PSEU|nr:MULTISPECIES: hypothetical protein [Amycolatopsis]MYW94164.1 hypothetical protein [Amycolatopsis rubida]NEC59153.1 hypothetical protein [Amycolatopsis rubida]OAP20921.1 hypothetical protein A4R44_08367 [Amycolatopsis sp. M39]
MSAASRQRTCAACGAPLREGERTDLEPLIDGKIRYVAVHSGHSTYAKARTRRSRPDPAISGHETPERRVSADAA